MAYVIITKMLKKSFLVFFNATPVILMIALIPYIRNDYLLTAVYVFIIGVALLFKRDKYDITFLLFGFIIMTASEYFFIKTGVETFSHKSLLGVMPLWLPFLWSYGFVAIKRSAKILGK